MVSVCGQAVYTLGAGKTDRQTDRPTHSAGTVGAGPGVQPCMVGLGWGCLVFPRGPFRFLGGRGGGLGGGRCLSLVVAWGLLLVCAGRAFGAVC